MKRHIDNSSTTPQYNHLSSSMQRETINQARKASDPMSDPLTFNQICTFHIRTH